MEQQGRRLRMGMVGGGAGSFIGPVHRMAAELDGTIELVAGAFSQDAARSRQAGVTYGISPDRAYTNFEEMMERESKREDAIDFVCIVTPNHLHLPIAAAALEHGFHVMSDKPATATLEEAQTLEAVVRRTGLLYGLTFTYTGYPLVREARLMARGGELGKIRKAVVQYSQGWLSTSLETTGHKQAAWRSDPAQSGLGGAIGDIGVHAFNLLEYVSGREVVEICADLNSVVAGRVAGRRLQRTAQARQRSSRSVCLYPRSQPVIATTCSFISTAKRADSTGGRKIPITWTELDREAESNPARRRGLSVALGTRATFACPWGILRDCWKHLLISIATSRPRFALASAIRLRN